jgi:hypothetical protein
MFIAEYKWENMVSLDDSYGTDKFDMILCQVGRTDDNTDSGIEGHVPELERNSAVSPCCMVRTLLT